LHHERGNRNNGAASELFTVDNPRGSGTIGRSGFRLGTNAAFLPRNGWGRLEFCLGETMNKADLVDRIAGACEISKTQATTAIDTAVDSITAALKKGDRVALIGFGTFSVSQRKARNGRNPQTGATIKIAARRVAKFTPGAELKKAVNKK
jgi:nucleoid DNA-binding protein